MKGGRETGTVKNESKCEWFLNPKRHNKFVPNAALHVFTVTSL